MTKSNKSSIGGKVPVATMSIFTSCVGGAEGIAVVLG